MMTEDEMIACLKASILNIGRLIPEGMTITFHRDPGAASTVEQVFPDGQMLTAVFIGHTPILNVPVVPATYGVAQ